MENLTKIDTPTWTEDGITTEACNNMELGDKQKQQIAQLLGEHVTSSRINQAGQRRQPQG